MTDERMRKLAREAAHGDAGAEARLLRERLRNGSLGEDQLRLLANLGHGAAREALGDGASAIADLSKWIAAFPRALVLRGTERVARKLLELHERRPALRGSGLQALDAVVAWIRAPSPEAVNVCSEAAMVAMTALNNIPWRPPDPEVPETLARSYAVLSDEVDPAARALLTCVLLSDAPARAKASDEHFALQLKRVFVCAEAILPGQTFRAVLCAELLPSALEACGG